MLNKIMPLKYTIVEIERYFFPNKFSTRNASEMQNTPNHRH